MPNRPALITSQESVCYGDLLRRISAAARRLRAWPVEGGDRVVLCGPNSVDLAIGYFAIHWIGGVAVPLEPGIPSSVLAEVVSDCAAKLVLIDDRDLDLPMVQPLKRFTSDPDENSVLDPISGPDEIADVLYTTGTAGARKGVVLTHRNILAATENITEFVGSHGDDKEMLPLPLSHSFGLGRLRCLALNGNTMVVERDLSSPATFAKRLIEVKATGLALVPTGFDILRRVTRDYLSRARSHLRYIEIGSMPMSGETRAWLIDLLPQTRICHHYGLTEASRCAFTEYHRDSSVPGTAGQASPNVSISIRNPDGSIQPARGTGEIVVRGEMVMREYWNRPDLTRRALSDGAFRTGDHGYFDEKGYLFLLGRKDDLISVGGFKVVPDEVEEKLRQYQGVRDAACIGIPDTLGFSGQSVKTYIVVDQPLSKSNLTRWLRARLEDYKIPRIIEVCETIPRTSSGKIQRYKLREREGV